MNNWQRLINDSTLRNNLKRREVIIAAMRAFFASRGYREIDVPLLAPALPAESYLEVFETTLLNRHRDKQPAYLTTSPEMYLKKLLVGGIGNCFAITKSFRNTEDLSKTHLPEFSLLEWYKVGANYKDLMEETEDLIVSIFTKLHGSKKPEVRYQGQTIDLSKRWERISMVEAFSRYAKLDLEKLLELAPLAQTAKERGYHVVASSTWEELFHQLYLNEVEPHFSKSRPLIIYDYPVQLAALAAKRKESDVRFVERFEVYIAGIELADCCTEVTDWKQQQARFDNEMILRKKLGKTDYVVDNEFINALKTGLPRCAGIALGIDRAVMLFCDANSIDDVVYFPASQLWKPKRSQR